MNSAVIITGISGGIGTALRAAFERAGDRVIGLDRVPPSGSREFFVQADLDTFVREPAERERVLAALRDHLGQSSLRALINNAATQVTRPFAETTPEDWNTTFNVNVVSAALLARGFEESLARASGCIINVASIHARLTKPGFVAYATSKAALAGLTRSLAVEIGARVRVNAIAPAAVETPMLRAGFAGNPEGLARLAAYHPSGRLGAPGDIGALAVFLASREAGFINGSVCELDGAIGARLHDPA